MFTHSLAVNRVQLILLDGGFHISVVLVPQHVVLFEFEFDVGVALPNMILILEVGSCIVD